MVQVVAATTVTFTAIKSQPDQLTIGGKKDTTLRTGEGCEGGNPGQNVHRRFVDVCAVLWHGFFAGNVQK